MGRDCTHYFDASLPSAVEDNRYGELPYQKQGDEGDKNVESLKLSRKQPWKEHLTIEEKHQVRVVDDDLRLWGNYVNAHS